MAGSVKADPGWTGMAGAPGKLPERGAMRTQAGYPVTEHLVHSRKIFRHMVDKVRSWDRGREATPGEARDYECLELVVVARLMGV